jgi:hypothetical protein
MRKTAVAFGLLALAACASPLNRGRRDYFDGMRRLRYDPAAARGDFEQADGHLAEALADPDLSARERVTAAAIRVRTLVELDRHDDAAALAAQKVEGYQPGAFYEGDRVGLALIKAHALDPERGFAELLAAERGAQTFKARLHLAWQEVRFLQRIGTPKAKAEAVKICDQHPGKLNFDEMKKQLQ